MATVLAGVVVRSVALQVPHTPCNAGENDATLAQDGRESLPRNDITVATDPRPGDGNGRNAQLQDDHNDLTARRGHTSDELA